MSSAAPSNSHHQAPIPPAVAQQAALAEELQKQAINGEAPTEEVPAPATPLEVTQQVPQPPATPPQQMSELDEWKHKANSAMGRVQASEARERQMAERLNQMEALLSGIQAARAPDATPTRPNYSKLITEEEERDYGSEFLEVVAKKAKDELLPELLEARAEIDDLKKRMGAVGQTIAKGGEEKVWNRLINVVPDAEQMNNDPDFLQWLDESDPYSGVKRSDMLAGAYARQDAQRVVNFFAGYKAERTAVDPQTQRPVAQYAARPALADFAAPGRGASSPPRVAGEKPIYTARDLTIFYADKRMGKYKGREVDADAIERDIFLAQREGRIRP